MISAIFKKEFYKIKWPWLMVIGFNLALMGYIGGCTRRLFILDHPEVVWYRVLHLGQIHYGQMVYAPLVSGILIACFQFLPEMWGQRFRLALHLPVSPGFVTLSHLLVGLTAYGLVALADLGALGLITSKFFTWEGVWISWATALPWTMAGAAAYLGGALTLLEPNMKQRAVNLILGAGIAGLYLVPAEPGAYGPSLVLLFLPLALMIPAILVPVLRFRYRKVG